MTTSMLIQVLRQPAIIRDFHLHDWDLLIRQARSSGLLARLFHVLEDEKLTTHIPLPALNHLTSACKQAQRQHQQVFWETYQIQKALQGTGVMPVLLKGAAYIYRNLPCAQGRTLSDIDILVPKSDIKKTEMHLLMAGWITTKANDYDKMYYREWTHEIPPIQHIKRGTVLDVHHNLFPVLNFCINTDKLWRRASFDEAGIGTLCLEDMLLHSATHLFLEGDFEHGLRDLTDLDRLFLMVGEQRRWEALKIRAFTLGLALPLFYAARYCHKILGTFVPENYLDAYECGIRATGKLQMMDWLFLKVLIPFHPSATHPLHGVAIYILYWRGHFNRMPLRILLPHLAKKALRSLFNNKTSAQKTLTPHA